MLHTTKVTNPAEHVSTGRKKRRVRPPKAEAARVLAAAFVSYPRLGHTTDTQGEQAVALKSWPQSERGQTLYHNELMKCCRVSLEAVSKKRAAFYDARPPQPPVPDSGHHAPQDAAVRGDEVYAATGPMVAAELDDGGPAVAPVTPPGGF